MQTSQEIAASLVAAIASDIYNQTEFAHLGEMDKSTVTDCIAELPLAELIKVAMAADRFVDTGLLQDLIDLQDGFKALRATGKVEL